MTMPGMLPRSNMTARKWSFTDRKRLSDEDPSTLGSRSPQNGSLRSLLGPLTERNTETHAADRKGCPFTRRFKRFFNGTLVKSREEDNRSHQYSPSFGTCARWSEYLTIILQERKNVQRNLVSSAIYIPLEERRYYCEYLVCTYFKCIIATFLH